jgi:ribonuclease HII
MININFEKRFITKHIQKIAGVDEAGRGPLAGPVVAACVLFSDKIYKRSNLKEVNDSKKLSEQKRLNIFQEIVGSGLPYGVGVIDSEVIDQVNILNATFLAMRQAIVACQQKIDFVLVDGRQSIPRLNIGQLAIVKGDTKVFTIAAASIIAKVTRDKIMEEYDELYPDYGFCRHKGYGTRDHLKAIMKNGPSSLHRLTFEPLKSRLSKLEVS